MTSRARLLATVVILAPLAFACRRASPTPGAAATGAPDPASSPSATATTGPPAGTAAPAVSATAGPPATAAPTPPLTTQGTQPQAPPPPAAATSAPPPTTQAEQPAATQAAATKPAAAERPAPQRPRGKITLPAKLGSVTFDHEKHAGKQGIACTICHHQSRPQKPQASESQACRDCHTMPAAPPMKTSLQAAFHDPKGASGVCVDCHRQKGGSAPVKCLECHKKK